MKKAAFVVGPHCFLPHPCGEPGYWARTDRCVAFVACHVCGARMGEMCAGQGGGRTVTTHSRRREEYQQRKWEFGSVQKQATYTIIEELPASADGTALTDADDVPDSTMGPEDDSGTPSV